MNDAVDDVVGCATSEVPDTGVPDVGKALEVERYTRYPATSGSGDADHSTVTDGPAPTVAFTPVGAPGGVVSAGVLALVAMVSTS